MWVPSENMIDVKDENKFKFDSESVNIHSNMWKSTSFVSAYLLKPKIFFFFFKIQQNWSRLINVDELFVLYFIFYFFSPFFLLLLDLVYIYCLIDVNL